MCTVTLTPIGKEDFVLYSNRDEAPSRISKSPEFYNYKNAQLLYPEDVESGGTWIGLSEKQRLICLLNGGFDIHQRQASYRHSRGIVVKDLLSANTIEDAVGQYDLLDIEPFTMIIVDWSKNLKFYELVWDGQRKHFKALEQKPHIWSSSTLYNREMRTERKEWFKKFKSEHELNIETLGVFHRTAGSGNVDYGVIMDRGFVKTTSITKVEKQDAKVSMDYEDLATHEQSVKFLNEVSSI
ncbi:NRDE family protein [Hanstruepera flava]|uniref:NRDE family protein n=1 Tax=Hanstruepera flava TaxID=2930218 RepID=UPI0020278325|nr:NRDE family protein [Hanstruepera flava]